MVKQPKPKKCKVCKTSFTPDRPLQQVCGYQCAIDLANDRKDRQERIRKAAVRRSDKERKIAAKSLTEWLDEAQDIFNKYIRLVRDADQPCISCGTTKNVQYCAGHYRTRKAASQLRFNEDNVHKQCNSHCNRHLSGNVGAYREALLLKIGPDRLAAIENNNEIHRYTIEEAKAIKAKYKQLLKDIKT